VEVADVLVTQLVTVCPCSVTYSSSQPTQGVIVAKVVHGVVVTVTVTAAQVPSASSSADFTGADVT
jgi:hypothetical protein